MALKAGERGTGKMSDLGYRFKDLITGYIGIANLWAESFTGSIQYGIQQPLDKDGKYPESYMFDFMQLEVVDEGVSSVWVEPKLDEIILGSEVKDKFSGYKGIAQARIVHLNGCIYIRVVGEVNKTKDDITRQVIEVQRLEVTKLAKIGRLAEVPRAVRRGGPVVRASEFK